MELEKPIRTYLDPDTVGPLPRCRMQDEADRLSASAMQPPPGASTVELAPEDVLEIFDPLRPRARVPSGSHLVLPRIEYGLVVPPGPARAVGRWLTLGVAAACLAILAAAALVSTRSAPQPPPIAALATPLEKPAAMTPDLPATLGPATGSTVGTLRINRTVDPQRVSVDAVPLHASAALVACGPHQVKVGAGAVRTIDVPCGGAITVFR